MTKKETYQVDVVSTRDYSVDFEQIYNAVIDEEGTNDLDCISDAFGDNVEYYLKKIKTFILPSLFILKIKARIPKRYSGSELYI